MCRVRCFYVRLCEPCARISCQKTRFSSLSVLPGNLRLYNCVHPKVYCTDFLTLRSNIWIYSMFINLLESNDAFFWCNFNFNSFPGLCIFMYAVCIFSFYALMPLFFRFSTATLFNMSLLTNNIYAMIFSMLFVHRTPPAGYFIAFFLVSFGLLFYNMPEFLQYLRRSKSKTAANALDYENP